MSFSVLMRQTAVFERVAEVAASVQTPLTGTASSRARKRLKLLAEHPHCHVCGLQLIAESPFENTASMCHGKLCCPLHIPARMKAAKKSFPPAQAKVRRNFEVDGKTFAKREPAESFAIAIAAILGSDIDIFEVDADGTKKRIEVARAITGVRLCVLKVGGR